MVWGGVLVQSLLASGLGLLLFGLLKNARPPFLVSSDSSHWPSPCAGHHAGHLIYGLLLIMITTTARERHYPHFAMGETDSDQYT